MLELRGITKSFRKGAFNRSLQNVLDDVDLLIERGKKVGVMGDSGSGKTTLARIAVRMIDPDKGTIHLDGSDLTNLSSNRMRDYRSQLQMAFQHPEGALDPEMKLCGSLDEALLKSGTPRNRLKDKRDEVCIEMNIPEALLSRYPMQVSGGEIQRVALARVLAFNPSYLFMDEPTSMLDVSIQAHILNVILKRSKRTNMGLVLITHDLDIVRAVCDDVAILYQGKIIGNGKIKEVFEGDRHPYIREMVTSWDLSKEIGNYIKRNSETDA